MTSNHVYVKKFFIVIQRVVEPYLGKYEEFDIVGLGNKF